MGNSEIKNIKEFLFHFFEAEPRHDPEIIFDDVNFGALMEFAGIKPAALKRSQTICDSLSYDSELTEEYTENACSVKR